MICGRCGTENRPGRRFCRSCGSTLALSCPACGAANEPGDRFCGECGASLPDDGATAGRPSPTQPGEPSLPATERRVVSVLFADLVGFTALADDRDPETVREFLAAYFDAAREIVERYGGTVEKFIGDAIMAVWGAPLAREDDAERAVRAALDLAASIPQLETLMGAHPQVRAAVLTGEAAVSIGAVGQGMVAGDLVNTASRLQGVAPPGTVLVGEATQRAAGEAIVFERAGEQLLRGKVAPVPAWQAVRVVAARGGVGRSARMEPPFVGRDGELQLLKDMLHATAREGRARLVSIVGQAGIGKSRLAWELEKYLDGLVLEVFWHRGHSLAYGDGLAYWALAEMIRERARIAETDDADTSRRKLAAMVDEHIADPEERAWVEPRLAALLGLGPAPTGDRETTEAAWRLLFERMAERAPVVMVFEELQWADDGLLDFIETMMDRSRGRPILVLGLARPELVDRRPGWGAGLRAFTGLHLERLTADDMELLLVGMAPGLPQPAVRSIVERADGIPLYAVEMVRMLLDTGTLHEHDGRFHLDGTLASTAVPETLAALIGARLDALPDAERALLGHAAVLGQSFTVDALASAAELPEAALASPLGALVRRELLRLDEDQRSPERGQYQFVQGLVLEVAYDRLSHRERLARHLAAARYFEALDDPELAAIVTSHYLEAYRLAADDGARHELATTVRGALLQAARRAGDLNAHRSELTYLEQAVQLATDERQELEILEPAWQAAVLAAETPDEYSRAADMARRGLELARALGDRSAMARAALGVARALTYVRAHPGAQQVLRSMLEELGPDQPAADVLPLRAELARAHLMMSDPVPVIEICDQALPEAEQLEEVEVIAELLVSRAWAIAALGRPREAVVTLAGVVPLCDRHGLLNARLRAAMNLSGLAYDDDPKGALQAATDGLAIARRVRVAAWATGLASNATELAIALGDWDWVEQLVADLDREGLFAPRAFGTLEASVATVRAFRGDHRDAERLTSEVFPALPMSDPQVASGKHAALAYFAFARGDDLEAFDAAMRSAGDINWARALGFAARAAAWLHDLGRLRTASEGLATSPERGRWVDAERATADGAIAALEGSVGDAVERFGAASAIYADLGLRFERALTLAEMAELLPDGEGASATREEARSVFSELGAAALLERLDRGAELPPAGGPRPGQATVAAERPSSG